MSKTKHILLSAELLLGIMFTCPVMNNIITITAMAAETYSDNWFNEKEDLSGTWYYRMNDGSLCTSSWVHDRGQWYLLDASGDMLTGVVKSNGGNTIFWIQFVVQEPMEKCLRMEVSTMELPFQPVSMQTMREV